MVKCIVCNCEIEEEKIKHIHVKGKPKKSVKNVFQQSKNLHNYLFLPMWIWTLLFRGPSPS